MAENIAGRIASLRADVQRTQSLRTDAETRLHLSRQRLSQIDKRLTEMGINPDNVDTELVALEEQFKLLADKLTVDLSKEAESYNKIIEQTKPVFGEVTSK